MKQYYALVFYLLISVLAYAQENEVDKKVFNRIESDTSKTQLNLDAVYNRPFLQVGKSPVLLGGYLEANTSYFGSDGVSDGLSFQIPRLTVFISASIIDRIKFLSEIEIEEGGHEIAIEFAAMDVEFHPLLNLRGGIVMNPIGAFNQNHDGPKWEFVQRPISATTIIPSTWSNVGFGLYGKTARNNWVFSYEAYLTNGFDDKIIDNEENRTWLPASKENPERFNESNNGIPLTTLKFGLKHLKIAEIGLSWMGGVYNKFEEDGVELDKKRRLDLFAVDFNTVINATQTKFIGEYVWAFIDVPETYSQQFGEKQKGGFLDIVQPIMYRRMLGWDNSILNLAVRLDYTDYNRGNFRETGEKIYDEVIQISPAISFRPSSQTVFRFNYVMRWDKDLLGNPATKSVGYLFGFSTYF